MTEEEYMNEVLRTCVPLDPKGQFLLGSMGLAGEAGEVIDDVKKFYFHGHPLDRAVLMDELGDALWYITLLAITLGIPLESLRLLNVQKLRERYPDGFDAGRSINR